MEMTNLLLLLAPVVLVELSLKVISLILLFKRGPRTGPTWGWAVLIVCVSLFGSIAFLLFGKKDA